ncbi:hypothetical protein ASPWEDRAFT_228130 [Aspergillus wentii DTO 134E9]|uniref:Uncharacterized protein n=1 Tax=Aspergillus wentii DTO 134E9 TaxID=1073089 RepID=A0A1L9S0M5_ASPWE|nr:uncharacterized protein ASPWEDRAFT_228130 [Aspergillus wentii DTO 134E9]OJJ40703.1 hypothetical protein ASPWEDRAFT_228130 [Aspergillus wentii DTO 134E9]
MRCFSFIFYFFFFFFHIFFSFFSFIAVSHLELCCSSHACIFPSGVFIGKRFMSERDRVRFSRELFQFQDNESPAYIHIST